VSADLEQVLRPLHTLQVMLPHILEIDTLGQVTRYQVSGLLREQDLPPMSDRMDAPDAVLGM